MRNKKRQLYRNDLVKALRQSKGLSQEELAKKSKTSRPSICDLESGADCRVSTLHKVADALGVPVSVFFDPNSKLEIRTQGA
ncbi:MAG: helix-turn-helix transcriptional regulator [Acidobacteriota bacterium]